jgi:hypothetical protein
VSSVKRKTESPNDSKSIGKRVLITGIQLLLSELAGVKPDDLLSFGLSIAVIFLSRSALTSNGCTSSIRS